MLLDIASPLFIDFIGRFDKGRGCAARHSAQLLALKSSAIMEEIKTNNFLSCGRGGEGKKARINLLNNS